MRLPDLSALSPQLRDLPALSTRDRWLVSCGNLGKLPNLQSWNSMRAKHKWELLHGVASGADGYVTPYLQLPVEDVIHDGTRTVEHVLPRNAVNAREGGKAENDFNGFVVAERGANSSRGSRPLLLWPLESELWQEGDSVSVPLTGYALDIQGERHFVPPLSQRARLARKWLFLRACYSVEDSIDPPSAAQTHNKNLIIAWCKSQPIYDYERAVNTAYRDTYDWANPLLEEGADAWYDSIEWRNMCFPAE